MQFKWLIGDALWRLLLVWERRMSKGDIQKLWLSPGGRSGVPHNMTSYQCRYTDLGRYGISKREATILYSTLFRLALILKRNITEELFKRGYCVGTNDWFFYSFSAVHTADISWTEMSWLANWKLRRWKGNEAIWTGALKHGKDRGDSVQMPINNTSSSHSPVLRRFLRPWPFSQINRIIYQFFTL